MNAGRLASTPSKPLWSCAAVWLALTTALMAWSSVGWLWLSRPDTAWVRPLRLSTVVPICPRSFARPVTRPSNWSIIVTELLVVGVERAGDRAQVVDDLADESADVARGSR